MNSDKTNVVVGCVLLVALLVALGISAALTVALHYALVQLVPGWADWVRWVLAFVVAGFLLNAGRTVTVRNNGR